jgi:flagellar motility protein MotE (MotC chaperone)
MSTRRPKRRPIGYPSPVPPAPPAKRTVRRFLLWSGIVLLSTCTLGVQWTHHNPAYAQGKSATSDTKWPKAETRGMREVLDALKARERALDRREQSLLSREADLRAVERDLEARIDELKVARTELKVLLKAADAAEDARIRALVKMVESMRAGDAANMVTELPNELAVSVLDRMKATKAGKLLAKMAPAKAAFLAEKLANKPQPLSDGSDAGGD